ncbi:ROK family protein [Mammaliicoccus sp. Dog046]|uniref:ROK family protein n=1 Tax=Mammaliicoccus sp. Dog046 TaxID=3034233 RepID=UPI002B25F764|nr:ROK family protein [Mammaliicoccus sp. Dog046]WQK85905.1 ROK family protein [Mammaliicoccus sp. Dog046]
MKLFGAIEAGGTKFVCAVGDEDLSVKERITIPTTEPSETMPQVIEFFKKYEVDSIGIGSFGPIDINKDSDTYGFITTTPKTAWKHFDLVGTIKQHFDIPVAFTTDVNTSLYGEFKKGIAKDNRSAVYYTIGTGIGGGAMIDGQFVQGLSHPEMGHTSVHIHPDDQQFDGNCPYHGTCLEGLASGPAIEKRAGKSAKDIPETAKDWDIVAYYIAQAAFNTTLMLSPEKIIFGGGVMHQTHLLEKVHQQFTLLNNDYIKLPPVDTYIVTPSLNDDQGIIGCLALARDEFNN